MSSVLPSFPTPVPSPLSSLAVTRSRAPIPHVSEAAAGALSRPARSATPGRGSTFNPHNRFERKHFEACPEDLEAFARALNEETSDPSAAPLRTTYQPDATRGILAHNDSPDIPFDTSVNPYRGCEHGCVYCYARPTHEYLGLSAGVDFESRIFVKLEAPALLRAELARPSWRPQVVALSGVTDPYQPVERRLGLTRRVLEVFAEFRNPVGVITKSALVTRDIDVLAELARNQCVSVAVSVTTLSAGLARILEPRAAGPAHRLHAIHALAEAGIPVGVMVAPVIPGLTDDEVPAILEAAAEAGARFASHVVLRLPHAVEDLFVAWLETHMPDRKAKVLSRLRSLRGGRLNDTRFGSRMRGEGAYAHQIADLFELGRRRAGLPEQGPELSTEAFRVPDALRDGGQLRLFA